MASGIAVPFSRESGEGAERLAAGVAGTVALCEAF